MHFFLKLLNQEEINAEVSAKYLTVFSQISAPGTQCLV